MDIGVTKHHIKYNTKEERLEAWVTNRTLYNKWRRTAKAYEFIDWKRKKQQGLCFICVKPLEVLIHIDHIFPLYLGGTNFKGNMCLTHPACNMDKGAQVYYSYKQACKRRRVFNEMRKARKLRELLKKNPNMKLSKKAQRVLKNARNFR